MTNSIIPRFQYSEQNLLSPGICYPNRKSGAPIAQGNYGYWNIDQTITVPVSNVGTVLTFYRALENYAYIEIVLQGTAAKLSVYPAVVGTASVVIESGTEDDDLGTYVLTIPASGRIQNMLFENHGNFVIQSVTAILDSGYTLETRDFNQLAPIVDVNSAAPTQSDDGTTISYTVPNTQVLSARFLGTLLSGYYGRCKVEIVTATGVAIEPQQFSIFDGINIYTCSSVEAISALFVGEGLVNTGAYIAYTNDTGMAMIVKLTPIVNYFQELVDAYRANPTPQSTQVNYIYKDTFDGTGSLENHVPNIGMPYTAIVGNLNNMSLTGAGAVNWGVSTGPVAPRGQSLVYGTSLANTTVELKFTPTVLGNVAANCLLVARDRDAIAQYAGISAFWSGTAWSVVGYVADVAGTTHSYSATPPVGLIVANQENIVQLVTGDLGTNIVVNGIVLFTTTFKTDGICGCVQLELFSPSSSFKAATTDASVYSNLPVPVAN